MFWIVLSSLLAYSNAQDFRTNVEGPILINSSYYVYYCNLLDSLNRPTLYDVVFLFDFQIDPTIPTFTGVKGNDRVALPQNYLTNKMNKQIRCRANNTQASVFVTSPNYINIGIERAFIKSPRDLPSTCDSCVTEADKDPLDIRFTATVPFRCPDTKLYTSCNISVNLTTTDNIVVRGVVADKPCIISFTLSDSDKLYHSNISIYAVKDDFTSTSPRPNYVLMNFPSFANVTMNGITYPDNWNDYSLQTDIRHIDKPRGYCTVSGVSQVKTFDGYTYQSGAVGQFSYVRSKSGTPFEVQLRHWPCTLDSQESCVCGLAVQEATVDVVVDMCIDGVAKFISHSCVVFPTDTGVKVISNAQRNRFAIIFPSGNRVYGSIVGRELSLDIYVNSDMVGLQEGLCGTFDFNPDNDIIEASNIEQWRLPINGSIFDGVLKPMPTVTTDLTSYSGQSYCKCNKGVATCAINMNNFDLMEQFTWGMNANIQPRVPADFGSCSFRMDASYYSRRYLYYNWATFNYAFSWPTASGITEAQAQAYCWSSLWLSSPIKNVCSALTQADLDGIIARCKTEIQIYGYNESAANIEPELGRLCISQGAATVSGQGATGVGSLLNLSLAYCDSFTCNFNGNCTNGVCACVPGIASVAQSDCAFFSSALVRMTSLYGNNLCDVRTQDCTKFLYYSQNVDAIFPWCRFNPVTVYFGGLNLGSKTQQGNVVDENDTICYMSKDHLDIITYPNDVRVSATYRGGPTLFNVSLGNEQAAALQSNVLQLLVYDSLCYNCTNVPNFSCTQKQVDNFTCFISGYCIPNNTIRSGDPTQYCNVDLSRSSWSAVPPPPPVQSTISTTQPSTRTQSNIIIMTSSMQPVIGAATTQIPPAITTTKDALTTTPLFEYAVLNKYLRRLSQIPKNNIPTALVDQLANDLVQNNIPKIAGCANFNNLATTDLIPNPNNSLADNMNLFLQTYCTNTVPSDGDYLAQALNYFIAMTTAAPLTLIPPGSDLQSDLEDLLGNFRALPYSLTTPQIQALALNLTNIMASNPDCKNANIKASLINPVPAWNPSLSAQQNLLNFLKVYCDPSFPSSLNSTANDMNNVLANMLATLPPTGTTTSTSSTLDGATIGAIVAGVLGSLALIALLVTCCCCWPYIISGCRNFCCCCCPWFAYPQTVCPPAPVCVPQAACIPTSVCTPEPVCTPVRSCDSGWRPLRASVYVRASPGCVDPCSKPVSRVLVPYKDRYCGSTAFGAGSGGCQYGGCVGTTCACSACKSCKTYF